jgi:hypothetical protein
MKHKIKLAWLLCATSFLRSKFFDKNLLSLEVSIGKFDKNLLSFLPSSLVQPRGALTDRKRVAVHYYLNGILQKYPSFELLCDYTEYCLNPMLFIVCRLTRIII